MQAQEIARFLSARLVGNPTRDITAAASLSTAGPSDLSFIEDAKYLDRAAQCRAGAVLAGEFAAGGVPGLESTLLIVKAPRLAFARAVAFIADSGRKPSGVHATAVVDGSARIGAQASIDAHAVVGKNVRIGARTRIGPGCVLFDDVALGEDCHLIARVTIYSKTTVGHRVLVHAGAVLGSDGFGFAKDEQTGAYHKFPQIGRLEIGDDVEIGANCTIDRAALDATVIAAGAKLDNMVHVGHNVQIGRNVVISAQTGIAGSSVIEQNVVVAGQVGIADHVHIEEGAILGAQCGVPSNKVIRGKGIVFWGTPARPIREYLKELAALARLVKKR
ncbi:MAG TPA: UDP-3-O-(3-hydroxymyristoyl)glucosamine N-acyltransferase [Vicinamibacterales bacterium]|jgi:UDP-3-O-[3-hydroxymyristoyl] glucosamine N-acyltransferase